MRIRLILKANLYFLLVLMGFNTLSHGKPLPEARAERKVCEGKDGYLHATPGSINDSVIQTLVKNINQKRTQEYKTLAAKNKISPEEAARVMAEQLREQHLACS